MRNVHVRDDSTILRIIRKEVLRSLRDEARRVRKSVADAAPKVSGNLRRKLKVRSGWDGRGPWARVITTARRQPSTKYPRGYRYGLTVQRKEHYLQEGLRRTPRR
jgi:hypothetical protein